MNIKNHDISFSNNKTKINNCISYKNCKLNSFNNNSNIMNKNIGYLELIIGPMYSGKTTSIIELNKQYSFCNLKTCIINYAEDKRYHDSKLSTHDKIMIDCYNTFSLKELFENNSDKFDNLLEKNDVFLINEGQFFSDLFKYVKMMVEQYNKIVHVCGLDGDFQRNGFEQIIKLIPLADNIVKKTSFCVNCKNGTKALFSYRITSEKEVKVIGSDNYIPLCRNCYLQYNK